MNLKWKNEIIFPEFERNVINRKMIEDAYLQSGYKGELLRLHQLEPFDYKNVTVLRLEFLNIIRIDNLWMMPNLTKLSLSGNKIEVIENLETLTSLKDLKLSFNFISEIKNLDTLQNLETLNLFNNLIATISGIDALENLKIFNLGNNKIESFKGLDRLRFLKKLIVFNMEGNPVSKAPETRMPSYVIAVLPQIKYYDYALIEDRVREKAREEFKYEIVEIETAEDEEIQFRDNKAKELEAELRYSSSFVEFLDEHQLYDSLWDDDEDGHTLLQISDSAAESLLVEYRENIFALTQEIFKLGLQKFDERKQEIDLYTNRTEEGELLIQKPSLKSIDEYNVFTAKVFKKTTKCQKKFESRPSRGKDSNSTESASLLKELEELSSGFYQTTSDTWHALIRNELHLHESILESISYFDRNMQEMVTKFIEGTQMYFVQIRNIAIRFSDNFGSVVQEYLESKFAVKAVEDVPDDLKAYLENKSLINELVSGMQNHHLRRIDDREKRLITRSKKFVSDLIERIQKEEFERNRGRILEINDYIDHMKSNFQTINVVNIEDGILYRDGSGK